MKLPNPFAKKSHITEEEDIYKDRYVEVPKKKKKKLGRMGKAVLCLLGAALVGVSIWVVYYIVHFHNYNAYRAYLAGYDYEEGTDFSPISESAPDVEGMALAAENEYLKLYTNVDTAEIAVYDKRNGEITYSNPTDLEEDPIANGTNKNYLRSQFILDYYNSARAPGTFDSYSASVDLGQVSVVALQDGIRYTYRVGSVANSTGIVPKYIRPGVLDDVMGELPEEEAETLAGYFRESTDVVGYMELKSSVASSTAILAVINDMFERAGFTSDDYVEELTEAGMESLLSPNFTIELEYRLNEDALEVSVPMCSVMEGGGAKIYRLQLLKFMGAAGTDQEGYMVVPNGSGSIINFNNGKTNVADYSQYIYGMDPVSQAYTVLENAETARLPLFGICNGNSNILATVEDGATLSFITASVAGKVNSYNYIYNSFVLRGFDTLSMFGTTGMEAELPVLEKDFYDVDLTVRYTFLDENHTGYSGMANYYRERLIAEGALAERVDDTQLPFYYDVIGGVKLTSHILGVQYLSVHPMTTFEEAEAISNDLAANGVANQVMNFQGWFNGGYYHNVTDRIRVLGKLGGKSDLESLSSTVAANGGEFYADVAFQKVTYISKHYQYTFEDSRYYGAGYVVHFGQINPSTLRQTSSLGYQETSYDLISPKFLPRYVGIFADKIQNYDISGISLRDLGDTLHSDRRRTNIINREEALDVVLGQLDLLSATGKDMMISGGNSYAFAYTHHIMNAPVRDNDYFMVDQDIPFYEMVIHGHINYCGYQLNNGSTDDMQEDLLEMIEYGTAPHYIFTWENATEMKYSGLNMYYATTYANWSQTAAETYRTLSEALDPVMGAEMIRHEALENGLRKVTYDNGVCIYVNYTDKDIEQDGILVPAKDYEIGGTN